MTKQFFGKKQTNCEKRRRQYNVFSTQQILLQEHQAENTGKKRTTRPTATLTDRAANPAACKLKVWKK